MRRCAWLTSLPFLLAAPAQVRADIVPFPTRPDWDTPVPMPSEVGWLALVVLFCVAASLAHALARPRR